MCGVCVLLILLATPNARTPCYNAPLLLHAVIESEGKCSRISAPRAWNLGGSRETREAITTLMSKVYDGLDASSGLAGE